MATKFTITAKRTIVTTFDPVEVEADDQASAEDIVQDMIDDGSLSQDGEDVETVEFTVAKPD